MSHLKTLIEEFKLYDISTPFFDMNGINTYGRIVDIYDGDTMKIVLPLMNKYYKFNVRLNGIDTCEIKSHNIENKNKALQARNKICNLIQEKWNYNKKDLNTQKEIKKFLNSFVCLVFVECLKFDKYGRLLANIYIDCDNREKCLSKILIDENLAYAYDGGTKLSEEDQI